MSGSRWGQNVCWFDYRGGVAVGFFGNEQVGKGAKEFFNSLDDANQTLGEISVTVSLYLILA